MSISMRQKHTHGHREHSQGCQGGERGGGQKDWEKKWGF